MTADSLSRLPCNDCNYCTKREVRDKTLQLEDPKTGASVRVLTRSQANQSTENPQTNSAVGMLHTDFGSAIMLVTYLVHFR